MTNWYESLNTKERRPFRLVVRKVMKATGFTGSNQNLDSYADGFLSSEFGQRLQDGPWWDNYHMVNDSLHEYMVTPEGDASNLGVKQDPKKDDIEKLYKPKMSYYAAQKIRQTGFRQRMLDKQIGGQGLGGSFLNTAGEGLRARAKMMGKLIDPMWLLKAIPFLGKNLSLSYGNMVGRSQSDLSYFGGKKPPKTSTVIPKQERVEEKSVEVLNELFDFMQTSRTEDLESQEIADNYNQLNEKHREDNHKEIMDALLNITNNKRKADRAIVSDSKKRKTKETTDKKQKKSVVRKQIEDKAVKEMSPSVAQGGLNTILKGAGEIAATASKYAAPVVAVAGLGAALGRAEAGTMGYSAANKGTLNDKIIPVQEKLDLENMTLAEIQRRQAIKFGPGDEQKLFAVGKYQMIPETLKLAMQSMKLSPTEKFTGALQERIYKEYLITIKRPEISAYLNSPIEDPVLLKSAIKAASNEWASVADPDIAGGKTSHYGNGNKASISVDEMAVILMKQRQENLSLPATEVVPPRLVAPTKPDVSRASTENADLWKTVQSSKKVVINYHVQNTSTIAQKSVMFNSGAVKREPHPVTGI